LFAPPGAIALFFRDFLGDIFLGNIRASARSVGAQSDFLPQTIRDPPDFATPRRAQRYRSPAQDFGAGKRYNSSLSGVLTGAPVIQSQSKSIQSARS
jgi:hypothetical protein